MFLEKMLALIGTW